MKKPDYLYHYTSIEGLAHILHSRQIRFSRLDLLDDLTEGQSKDHVDWRKYFFVSCWTADAEESIPLWSMYTPSMKGVRIKLPTDMFKKYPLDTSKVPSFIQLADTSSAPPRADIKIMSYLPYDKLHGEDYFVMAPCFAEKLWPFPVEYTENEDILNQNLITYDPEKGQSIIRSFEVAKYKKRVWAFQNEWRFRIYCHNAAPRSMKDKMTTQAYFELMLKELASLEKGVSQEYFFMELNDDVFDDMNIVLGPKVNASHEIIVESLIKSHCPKANLAKSRLTGLIR